MRSVVVIFQWIIVFVILSEFWIVFQNMRNRVHSLVCMNCVSMLLAGLGYLMSLYCKIEEACFMTTLIGWFGKILALITLLRLCVTLCRYTIPKWLQFLELTVSALTGVAAISTRKTGLFYTYFRLEQEGEWIFPDFGKGPWYYVWDVLVLLVLLSCLAMLIRSCRQEKSIQTRKQYLMIIVGLGVELLIGLLTMLPVSRYYDFNQVGYAICALCIIIAIFKYGLMKIEITAKDYIIDELSSGVIVTDSEGEVAYYNNAVMQVFPEIAEHAEQVLELATRAAETGEPITQNERRYTFEEKQLSKSARGVSMIYVMTDSTGHYRHLQELEEQKRIADSANSAKSDFLARMSHEIRTPINTVLGMDEMIFRESTERAVKDYAMDIQKAGNTLLSIINDILDFNKIESGRLELAPVEYDVSTLLSDMYSMALAWALDKDIEVKVSLDPSIPSKLFGDDVRIRRILTNLLTNAVKYTNQGQVVFRVSRIAEGKDADPSYTRIRFDVEDTGVGIKPEDIAKLFSDFERIAYDENKNIEGTGLGLSITNKLLLMMDSRLQVESRYGVGSIFSFDLEQKIVDDTPIGDYEQVLKKKIPQMRQAYAATFVAPDAHVLLVDDNKMNRKVFVALLKKTQMKITEAEGGQEAVEKASAQKFDIIFMDHMMPGMDGIEAMKRIKAQKDGPCANTPIIVLTANAVVGSKEKYLDEGFDGFLSKPIAPDKLENAVRSILYEGTMKTSYFEEGCEELPPVFGVDWEIAMMRIQDRSIVRSVLQSFFQTITQQADKLEGFYSGLPDSLEDYRIMVHGMKSASGYIGIVPLSGMAALLERAASEGDLKTIEQLHEVFVKEWRGYKGRMGEYLDAETKDRQEKEMISVDALKLLLSMLSTAMDEMDIGGADEAIEKLLAYQLPESLQADMEQLKDAVADFDQIRVGKILATMEHNINGENL
ncbi:MAG: response regulator [Lachnospiraceae bacterium]|nr:response regulator [Lachnospiraceae bacterium]